MGDQESRNERHATAFQQGLELLDRGALLVPESSPQIAEHWDQVEGRLQRMEANVLTLQNSVDRIQAHFERVEDEIKRLRENDRLRETQLSALQKGIDKAIDDMFPRVDALLTQIESTKRVNFVKEEQIESTENINSVKEEEIVIASSSSDNVNAVVTRQFSSNSNVENSGCLPLQQVTSFSSSLSLPEPIPSSHNHPLYENWGELDNALLDAAKEGRAGDIQNLLAAGANINTENVEQRTPLMLAACEGHADCLSMLLQAGANADCSDCDVFLPHPGAACRGHERAVRVCVDVNKRDGVTGATALALAASKGHTYCVFFLLQNYANVNISDMYGETPLHSAVMYSHARCVSLLLDFGANVNYKNKSGMSPRHYANLYGTLEVVQLLRRVGGRQCAARTSLLAEFGILL